MAYTADRHYSFPARVVKSDDGDVFCEGLATDGSIDHDEQIVDPQWAAGAFKSFFASGPNIRMAHDGTRPVGVGVDWRQEPDGGIWVKSCIVDPLAQRMLRKGVLRAYSVGISRASVVPDARARGGRIAAGSLTELSLVDRPANPNAYVTLCKMAGGAPKFIGKAFTVDQSHYSVLDNCRCGSCMKARKSCGCPACKGVVKAAKAARREMLAASEAVAHAATLAAYAELAETFSNPALRTLAEDWADGR